MSGQKPEGQEVQKYARVPERDANQPAAHVGLSRLTEIVRGRKTDGFDLFTISGDELAAVDEYRADLEAALAEANEKLDAMRRYRESQEGLPEGTLGRAVT